MACEPVSVTDAVLIDLELRRRLGRKHYGVELRTHNGRHALTDAYEEALDMACYLKQAILEQEGSDASLPPAPPTLSEEDMTAEEKTIVRLRAENESLRAEVAALKAYDEGLRLSVIRQDHEAAALRAEVQRLKLALGDAAREIPEVAGPVDHRIRMLRQHWAARSSAAGEDTDG